MINKHLLKCPYCLDEPQPQLRAIIIPPDPDPVYNARPEQYSVDEGPMPLTTEGARTGDPGSVIRREDGTYIGVDTPPPPPDI